MSAIIDPQIMQRLLDYGIAGVALYLMYKLALRGFEHINRANGNQTA